MYSKERMKENQVWTEGEKEGTKKEEEQEEAGGREEGVEKE